MKEQQTTSWERPAAQPDIAANRPGRSADDLADWHRLIDDIISIATTNGWTRTEVARRIDMAEGTFSQWFSAKYDGRLDTQNRKVDHWLMSVSETSEIASRIPTSPGFIATKTAREVMETLAYAQMMPEMVTVTLAAGMGKTMACQKYCASRPHSHLVTMRPNTRTVHGMLVDLAAALGVVQHNPAKLDRAIGSMLEKSGGNALLVVDEAQNLKDEAIDQLRHFLDIYRCGVALVGNEELYSRFAKRDGGPSYAQIRRRIGKRLKRMKPRGEDLNSLLDAWSIEDPDMRRLLTGIGMKDGALGQIDKTLKLACMIAAGGARPLGIEHIRAAWQNRDVEDMA